jgi:hypothetical protein
MRERERKREREKGERPICIYLEYNKMRSNEKMRGRR